MTATLLAVDARGRRRFLSTAIGATAIGAAGCRLIVGSSEFTFDGGATASVEGGAIAPPATDFYVDPAAPDADATYPTIAKALAAANASAAPSRTIHVAAGMYSTDSGESFPIILRDGVSLVGTDDGDGVPATVLSGVGMVDVPIPPGIPSPIPLTTVLATVLARDAAKPIGISHIKILSAVATASAIDMGTVTVGIACDEGVAERPGAESPKTHVDDLRIEGFVAGIYVTYSSSGCAALVTRTTISAGYFGVWASGAPEGTGTPSQRVSLQLGDGHGNGNTLVGLHLGTVVPEWDYSGSGLFVGDGVARATVLGNQFRDSEHGIWILQTVPADPPVAYDIEDNDFGPLDNSGIAVIGPSLVDPLSGNSFHDIVADPVFWFLAVGLILQPNGGSAEMPAILARRNSFVGNDVGIMVRTGGTTQGEFTTVPDFGTPQSPGQNVFHCNSSTLQGYGDGGDVWIQLPYNGPATLPFEGNEWDHSPPTGNDLIVETAGLEVDPADASSAEVVCGPPHVP
jgi:hypothetical protein